MTILQSIGRRVWLSKAGRAAVLFLFFYFFLLGPITEANIDSVLTRAENKPVQHLMS